MDDQRYGRHSKAPLLRSEGPGSLHCVALGEAEGGVAYVLPGGNLRRMVVMPGSSVNSLIAL